MRAKIGLTLAVLRFGAVTGAVGQYGLQCFEIGPPKTDFLIHNEAGEPLAYTTAHDPGLVVVNAEAFFQSKCGCVRGEALNNPAEVLTS